LTGTPVIASLRTAGYDLRYHSAARWQLETWVLRYGAQRIMAVGYVVADVNRERLPGKHITVVPNAVFPPPDMPPDEQLALRTELAGDSSRPILISVGRLELPKGFSDLLVAMAILRETHPRAILLIAGDGKLRAELTAQITELKLDRHVKLLGIRNDVPRLLAASDIYVNSSHWEGLPVSVLEAMAAGLPVVATNVGDTPRVVVDGTGMIVPPKQPELVASTLRSLLDDPGQMHAIGEKARLHIASHHSPEAWFNQLLTLYKDAMKH
jgi:glycosyltransferase involved in cell wall biosynthesis